MIGFVIEFNNVCGQDPPKAWGEGGREGSLLLVFGPAFFDDLQCEPAGVFLRCEECNSCCRYRSNGDQRLACRYAGQRESGAKGKSD